MQNIEKAVSSAPAILGYPITVSGVRKVFQAHAGQEVVAIDNVSLEIESGAFVALVGPSGCGKSTLLNCIAGLDKVEAGCITVNNQQVTDKVTRGVSYMFQQDTLFPWYNVEKNIALGLRYAGKAEDAENQKFIENLLEVVDLKGARKCYPSELSGGMRRRVALCAALVVRPRVLLMDEPFGALDTFTKASIQQYLLKLWDMLRPTVLFVTHDLEEAVTLADRVIIFSRRPANIKDDIKVELPRPRNVYAVKDSPVFLSDYQRTWRALREEFESEIPPL
jgi:NitT/TauT family transport system ATP-binding protein